ncbi:thioredoxin family protein [Aquimarina aquimarini]|uniref:thioredoxin family protein n=1 Tax=Aquimarina aquimarini TaxID=1191734 RepID=UPI000D560557|nr:thioredoxin family protein [Aquimarina aquimarini]
MNKFAPIIIVLFLVLFCNHTNAQDWKYDFEEATTLAKEKDQNIVLLFTGSDWCPPCMRLEKYILSDKEFIEYAGKNFVWVKADFPKRRKNKLTAIQRSKNKALARKYNKRMSFPVILVLNNDGTVLGATGYRRNLDVKGYISLLTSFDSFGR